MILSEGGQVQVCLALKGILNVIEFIRQTLFNKNNLCRVKIILKVIRDSDLEPGAEKISIIIIK